jgi:hypothetical protein
MSKYKDMMEGIGFISAEEAQLRFGFKLEETGVWNAATRLIKQKWQFIFNTSQGQAFGGEWLGVYPNSNSNRPCMIVQAKKNFDPILRVGRH